MSETTRGWWERMASPAAIAHKDTVLTGLVVVGAVFAWAMSPLQRYADPNLLFAGSFLIAVGLLTNTVIPWTKGKVALTVVVMPFFAMGLGAMILYLAGTDAMRKSRWSDKRCMIVQRAMLHPTSKTRSDIADVFSALGCRPQGGEPEGPPRLNPRGIPVRTAQEAAAYDLEMENALANEVDVNSADVEPVASRSIVN